MSSISSKVQKCIRTCCHNGPANSGQQGPAGIHGQGHNVQDRLHTFRWGNRHRTCRRSITELYIVDTCSVNEVPGVWFEEWIRLIMARLKDRLTEMNSDNSFAPDRSSRRQYKGAIKALQQDFASALLTKRLARMF